MEKKEKVIRIIRYVISIFIYLMALVSFSDKYFLSGIILVLSGTILLPILDDLLKFKHKRIIEVLATIILFILGMGITPASKEGYNNSISENVLLNTNEIVNSTNEIDNETNNVENYIENNTIENNEENTIKKTNIDDSKLTQISTSTSNSNLNSNKQSKENNNQSQSKTQSKTQEQAQTQSQQMQTQAQTTTTTTNQTEQKQPKTQAQATTSQVEQKQTKSESTQTTQSQTTTSSNTQKSSETTSYKQPTTSSINGNQNNDDKKVHTYILNNNTKKFHYENCDSAKKIKDSNREQFSGTRQELINKGYLPCKRCNP